MKILTFPDSYRIEFKYGASLYADAISVFNIYSIDIDTINKSMELNDKNGFVVGHILYEYVKEVGCYLYDENDNLDGHNEKILCKFGELNYKLLRDDDGGR